MKIVTGYQGFIGSRLYDRLKQSPEEIVGVEQNFWKRPHEVEPLVKECDGIYHIGANSSTTYMYPDIFDTNFLQSIQLLKLCNKYGIRMVFASSAAIYGTKGQPENFYAWTKLCTELVGFSYDANQFVALRYFNVYGPGEEHKGKMASVAYQAYLRHARTGQPFKLFTGSPKRDFVYVDDVVDATIHAMECDGLSSTPYDVGTGKAEPFEDLLDGMNIPYEHYTNQQTNRIMPSGYQSHTKANADALLPNWTAKHDVKSGTQLYREYLTEKENG